MSGPAKSRQVLDLWAVQQLAVFGVRLRVRTFLWLCAWFWFVLLLIMVSLVRAAVLLAAQLLGPEAASTDLRLAGLCVAVVAALTYLVVLDVLRERYSNARFAISRSRVRGLWVALDMPLRTVVLIERGLLVAVKVSVMVTGLLAAALVLRGRGDGGVVMFMVAACSVPLGYGAVAVAIALRQATRCAVTAVPAQLVGLLVAASAAFGYALSVSGHGIAASRDVVAGDRLNGLVATAMAVIATAGLLGLVGGTVMLALAWRSSGDHEPEVADPGTGAPKVPSADRAPSVLRTVIYGTGGPRRIPIVARGLVLATCLTAAVAGAYLDRGVLTTSRSAASLAITRSLLIVGAGAATLAAGSVLLLAGQTGRLWHYRALWELGVDERRIFGATLTFSVVPAGLFSLLLSTTAFMVLGRVPTALPLIMLSVVLSDHLSDSFFARPIVTEADARSSNTLLALMGYALMLPALLLGLMNRTWSLPVLAVYAIVLGTGGAWCFGRRIRSMVVLPSV